MSILTRCGKCQRFHGGDERCKLKWGRRGFLAMLGAVPVMAATGLPAWTDAPIWKYTVRYQSQVAVTMIMSHAKEYHSSKIGAVALPTPVIMKLPAMPRMGDVTVRTSVPPSKSWDMSIAPCREKASEDYDLVFNSIAIHGRRQRRIPQHAHIPCMWVLSHYDEESDELVTERTSRSDPKRPYRGGHWDWIGHVDGGGGS